MNDIMLFDKTNNIPGHTQGFFEQLGKMLERNRQECCPKNPEFMPVVDYMSSALQNKLPLRSARIHANDGVGAFTIEIGAPSNRERVKVFARKHGPLDPSNPKGRNPGELFLWGQNGLRKRRSYNDKTALWIINSVLANGGIYAAVPIEESLDDIEMDLEGVLSLFRLVG